MTRTDTELERDLRAMLHQRALDVPEVEPDELPALAGPGRRPRRRVAVVVGLAAAVAVALPLAVALGRDGDVGDDTTEVGPATAAQESPPPSGGGGGGPIQAVAPDGTSLRLAAPLFVADGSPADVARAYLDDRGLGGRATVDGVDQVADTALARWSILDDAGVAWPGAIELHRAGGRWGVHAATSSALAVDVTRSGGTLTGTITTPRTEQVCADVLTPAGDPVASAPDPDSVAGGPAPRGTAGCATAELAVDVTVGDEPVVVRVTVVGDGVLAISEVRLDTGTGGELVIDLDPGDPGTTTTEPATTTSVLPDVTTAVELDRSQVVVLASNAAGIEGLAGAVTDELAGLGWSTAEPGVADSQLAVSRIYAQPGFDASCEVVRADLVALVPDADLSEVVVQPLDPATVPVTGWEGADCVVVLGQDLAVDGG